MSGIAIPAGYVAIDVGGAFMAANGPLYAAWHEGRLLIGLRVEERHCNPAGACHGGMLASFADMMLPYGAMYSLRQPRRFTPTISLRTDFTAPVPLGAWLIGCAEQVSSGRSTLFVQGTARVDGEVVMLASGVFKWGELVEGAGDRADPFGVMSGGGDDGLPEQEQR